MSVFDAKHQVLKLDVVALNNEPFRDSLFDALTDYEVTDILVNLDNIWDVAYATTICKRFQKLILENKNMFFMEICGVDITKQLEYEDKNALCSDLPKVLNYSGDDEDTVAIYKLMSMMCVKNEHSLYYDEIYHELLYSDDFRPDILILNPGYLGRFKHHEDKDGRDICREHINGYISCFEYKKKLFTPIDKSIMKYSSGKIFNTEKYKHMLSEPFEDISTKRTRLVRDKILCHNDVPYTFYKSKIMNKKYPRTNARDIINIIVGECEHHCACWSETGIASIKITSDNGMVVVHVRFDTESG